VCAESLATSDHTADGTLDDLEARRPNPMKKGGWLKISSHVGADAQAQAELAVMYSQGWSDRNRVPWGGRSDF